MAVAIADIWNTPTDATQLSILEVVMSRSARALVTLLACSCAPFALSAQELLTAGTVLVYRTPDGNERAWVVEEATPNVTHGGRTGCMRVRYAAGGPTAGPDEPLVDSGA